MKNDTTYFADDQFTTDYHVLSMACGFYMIHFRTADVFEASISYHTVPIAAYFKRDSSAVRQLIQSLIGDHTLDKGDQYITCINGKSGGLHSTTLVLK